MNTNGTLYVVATPIGNLGDMTYRAVEVLKVVDLILCEDTRTSKTLLMHYGIHTKTSSYHAHSSNNKHDTIIEQLQTGKNIALISDAGTPGISDPGSLLISYIRTNHPKFPVIPLPGACAITTLLSVSGFMGNEFTFLGFVPHKKGRETFFKNIAILEHTVVFYESCHRIVKTLTSLANLYENTHTVMIGREMTKKFETYSSGTISQILENIQADTNQQKGEFVIILVPFSL
jgi:16S rRNA (cytidine1402-2'-O)-methyltransferase